MLLTFASKQVTGAIANVLILATVFAVFGLFLIWSPIWGSKPVFCHVLATFQDADFIADGVASAISLAGPLAEACLLPQLFLASFGLVIGICLVRFAYVRQKTGS